MTLSHAEYMRRERLRHRRKRVQAHADLTTPCVWVGRRERPRGKGWFSLGRDGRVYSIGEVHGGGWCALVYGPRGALLNAKDFWQLPDPHGQARAWCEAQWGTA